MQNATFSPGEAMLPKNMPRLLIIAVAAFSCLSATGNAGTRGTLRQVDVEQPRPIRTVVLDSQANKVVRKFPGQLRALQDVFLSFRVSGPLIELPVAKGREVRKGELVARIDPRDFENTLASITADVGKARENLRAMEQARPEDLARLRAAVNAATATAENDRLNLERAQNLFEQRVVPRNELDRAEATYRVSKSALEDAEQALKIGMQGARPEDINAAKAAVESLTARMRAAQDALSDTELRAPFDGVISERYVENFQMVAAQQQIVSIQDLREFEVVFNIPSQLIVNFPQERLVRMTTATARFDTLPGKVFPLTFKEFSTRADQQVQTFAATYVMSIGDGMHHFLPGMSTSVELEITRDDIAESGAFSLPVGSVLAGADGKHYVWRLADTGKPDVFKAVKSAVTLGRIVDSGILITDGVHAGERFAVSGVNSLREGMLVTSLPWEEEAR